MKEDNVLPGQDVQYLLELVAFRRDLSLDFIHAHLMFRTDRHGRVFFPKFQQHQPSIRFQRVTKVVEHALRSRQFVINIHHDHHVESVSG